MNNSIISVTYTKQVYPYHILYSYKKFPFRTYLPNLFFVLPKHTGATLYK